MDKPIPEDVVDAVAQAIADVVGHGMAEKCEAQARAAIEALTAAQQQGQAVAWLRHRPDGTPDWDEDCIGTSRHFLPHGLKSAGYTLRPLIYGDTAPPSAPVVAIRKAKIALLAGSFDSQDRDCIDKAIAYLDEALAQQPAAVFRNDGNTEADFIAHEANACTACGGSGHKADQQPAAVDEARAMELWDEFRQAGNHEHDALIFVLRALATQHQEPTT